MYIVSGEKFDKAMLWLGLPVAVILVACNIYFLCQYHTLTNAAHALTPLEQIEAKVGKMYPLPKDEQPTLAQIQDASKVSNQPFFKDAQSGDDVLIYETNKLAVIFRPSTEKIVNAGPATINVTSTSSPQSSTPDHFANNALPVPSQ